MLPMENENCSKNKGANRAAEVTEFSLPFRNKCVQGFLYTVHENNPQGKGGANVRFGSWLLRCRPKEVRVHGGRRGDPVATALGLLRPSSIPQSGSTYLRK